MELKKGYVYIQQFSSGQKNIVFIMENTKDRKRMSIKGTCLHSETHEHHLKYWSINLFTRELDNEFDLHLFLDSKGIKLYNKLKEKHSNDTMYKGETNG